MRQKNYTEVLIDGTIYTVSGLEDELYLQKVAAYLSDKIGKIKKNKGYGRLSAEYQALFIELNIADDYFKEQERAQELENQKSRLEKDTYSLKHELITNQMKLESLQKELEEEQNRVNELQKRLDGVKAEQEQRKAFQAAAAAAGNKHSH
ncbi:MAG: cell division protein ZapA [Clostridiales bacterium]|nr:cell division protein ZapA [Clostridiales bacterium]